MKVINKIWISIAFFVLAVFLFSTALVELTEAAPTVRPEDGKTSVELSSDLIDALTLLEIAPGVLKPASLKDGVARFPIPGGGIDVGNNLAGEILHLGGLTLTDTAGTTVMLFNFIIDTTGSPVLTGLVAASGDLVGRAPLFDLDLSNAVVDSESDDDEVVISGVVLTLTAAAADALNGVFFDQDPVFEAGLEIGIAMVSVELPDDDDDDDDDDEDND